MTRNRWILIAVAAVVILVGLANRKDPVPTSNRHLAFTACTRFVSQALKSPGSARYPREATATVTGPSTGPYVVRSYVDADNSFGASMRTPFTCTVSAAGDGLRLDDLQMATP